MKLSALKFVNLEENLDRTWKYDYAPLSVYVHVQCIYQVSEKTILLITLCVSIWWGRFLEIKLNDGSRPDVIGLDANICLDSQRQLALHIASGYSRGPSQHYVRTVTPQEVDDKAWTHSRSAWSKRIKGGRSVGFLWTRKGLDTIKVLEDARESVARSSPHTYT